MLQRLLVISLCLFGHLAQGLGERPECQLWSKLENKSVPLQNHGHANCTTNDDCTGFNCVGLYQNSPMSFGMKVHPCRLEPGVEIFGYAPQFSRKNFSHIFYHEDQYEIPDAFLNASMLSGILTQVPQLAEIRDSLRARLAVHLRMNHDRNVLIMGLTMEACVNESCIIKMPIFNNSEIPVPACSQEAHDVTKTNSVCNIGDISSCGENQICVQEKLGSNIGTCQCQSGFSYESDGTCQPNIDTQVVEDQVDLDVDNDIDNRRDKKSATVPDNTQQSSAVVYESSNGGAIAAAVISVIIVVALAAGVSYYVVMRTRLLPRLRARMTNTPYECANLSHPPTNTETALP